MIRNNFNDYFNDFVKFLNNLFSIKFLKQLKKALQIHNY